MDVGVWGAASDWEQQQHGLKHIHHRVLLMQGLWAIINGGATLMFESLVFPNLPVVSGWPCFPQCNPCVPSILLPSSICIIKVHHLFILECARFPHWCRLGGLKFLVLLPSFWTSACTHELTHNRFHPWFYARRVLLTSSPCQCFHGACGT